MTSQRGRPRIDNPKSTEIKIRATEQDKQILRYCCEKLGKTQYDVVMDGIRKVYQEIDNKKDR